MTMANYLETDSLEYFLNATALPWAAATQFDIHLHTADPGEGNASTSNEATYTSYAVVTKDRDGAMWIVAGNSASNGESIEFPTCTGGSNTITHFSITPQGATDILFIGALSASLAVANTIKPIFPIGSLTITAE